MLDHPNSTWEPEAVQQLIEMWNAGKSAGEIAKAFGGDVTRSAVIGKVHRLKLPPRLSNADAGRVKAIKPHGNRNQPKVQAILANARRVLPTPAPVEDIDTTGLVSLLDLERHSCRWPVTGEGSMTLFCGAHSHLGPYCELHSRRAGAGYGNGARP